MLSGWPWRWKGGCAVEPGAGTALGLHLCPCCSPSAFGSGFSGAGLPCPHLQHPWAVLGCGSVDAPSLLPCYWSQPGEAAPRCSAGVPAVVRLHCRGTLSAPGAQPDEIISLKQSALQC